MIDKRIAVLQSSYIPWKGYFDIIHEVDDFIFYDDVQFTKSDWRSRNRIKTSNGPLWLSIPAGSDQSRLIHEVQLKDSSWQAKHWTTLRQAYGKCQHFGRYAAFFEDAYLGRTWTSLSEFNQYLIKEISHNFLGIQTKFHDSREYSARGQKLDRLLALIRHAGATSYVSGPAARDYIDPEQFEKMGVELSYIDYSGYPEYPQPYPPFQHDVSVLDLLFNTGDEAPHYIWGWRNER